MVTLLYFTGYISVFSSNQNHEVGGNANWSLPWYWWYRHFTLLDIFLCFPVTRTMKLVVMLTGHNHGIDGNSTGSTQSSTLFSGKERGIIYSVL